MSQKHTKREKTHSDICESKRSQGRTRPAQSCTAPHRDRCRPSQTCADPPATVSRSSTNPSSPSCSSQGVEARRMKKSCHEASETSSCVRGRPQACERSVRGYERQRRAHGHDVPLTCAPHGGQPGRALGVEEVALVLSPAVSATPRPPAAGSRRLRRCATLLTRSVSSSRATPSQPCRRLLFNE